MAANRPIILDENKPQDRRVALATLVGTTVEWYDFFIYAQAAAIILPALFFDHLVENWAAGGQILAFASVGASFFFRPLGAAVAGHFGDKVGRKGMLVATLMLMGVATFLIGCMPTYAQIGIAAPLLLLLLRFAQGFAAGGEWGGAALMAVEHAPANKRGWYGGFPQIGVPTGMLIALIVMTSVDALTTEEQFVSWGWRVPFLLSVVLIITGMIIRLGVAESPIMEKIAEQEEQIRLPIVDMFRTAWKPLVLGAFVFAGNITCGYMITGGYLLNYTTKDLGMDRGPILQMVSIAAAAWIFTTLMSAKLSDTWTRTRVFKVGFVLQAIWIVPLFLMTDTKNIAIFAVAVVLLTIPLGMTYGPQSALFAEIFPAKIRYSGAGLAYAFGSILGGFTPMIARSLQNATGSSMSVAGYLLVITGIALLATFMLKDRTGQDISAEADAEINRKIAEVAASRKATEIHFDRGVGY